MHSLLIQRADALIGCTDGSADQGELEAIGEVLEAYEALRWPDGKIDGGKVSRSTPTLIIRTLRPGTKRTGFPGLRTARAT